MKYLLIILTIISAIFAELVGLTHEGIPWSKFPRNLTKSGLFFMFLTIVLGIGSIYALALDEKQHKSDKDALNLKITAQQNTITELKGDISSLENTLNKYQHPIPDKFQIWLELEFTFSQEKIEKELTNFTIFNSVYFAFLFHDEKGPKIFGVDSKNETLKKLKDNKQIIIRENSGKLEVYIMWLDLTVGESSMEYKSIYDLCGKYGEVRIELYTEEGAYFSPFKARKVSLFTPTKNELTIKDLAIKNSVGARKIEEECWK